MLTLEQKTSGWFVEKSFQGNGVLIPVLEIDDDEHHTVPVPLTPLLSKPIDAKIFLRHDPGIQSSIPKDEIQRGQLICSLTFQLPDYPAKQSVFLHELVLRFINRDTGTILERTGVRSGRNISIVLTVDLDKGSCEEYLNILEGVPGALHIVSTFRFYVPALKKFKTFETIQPLSKIIQWSGLKPEQLHKSLALYSYNSSEERFTDIPRIRSTDPQKRRGDPKKSPQFVTRNGIVGTNHAILQPVANLHAASIINSPMVATPALSFKIDNLILVAQQDHFPVVDKLEKAWYKDSKIPNTYWARPSFEILSPAQNADVSTSPFKFLFRQLGTGTDGKPVLEGEIRITLKYFISPQVKQDIEATDANAKIRLIMPSNNVIHLEIPFFTEDGKASISTLLTEELAENNGTITALFRLTNQWVRLCYGIISAHNPAADQRASVRVAYSFDGLEEEVANIQPLLLSQNLVKIAALPVMKKSTRTAARGMYFDVSKNTLHYEDGRRTVFSKEGGEGPRGMTSPVMGKLASTAVTSPEPAVHKITLLPLVNLNKLTALVAEKKYIRRTFLFKEQQVLNFDCALFGTFYLEKDDDGLTQSIGCKEPYKLGEIDPRLFVPLEEVSSVHYKVYRSTQIPNRFLVLPARYVVTRYEPEQEAYAFQTCMRLYSTIDAEELDRSRCMLDVTLAPDIPRFELEELQVTLKSYTPYEPFISFPTEIEHTEKYQWSIPGNISEDIESFSFGMFIRLVVAAKIEGVLTLQAVLKAGGLSGKIDLELPDHTLLSSQILVSLQSVKGPFINGSLLVKRENNALALHNPLRNVINLMFCNVYGADASKTTVVMERSLQPDEDIEFSIDTPGNAIIHYTVDEVLEDLEESRQYLEDIECQIIFHSTIDFDQEKIKDLMITFGLVGQEQTNVQLNKDKTLAEEIMIMPITDFLDKREVQYTVKVNKVQSGQSYTMPLNIISLSDNGNIIHLNLQSIAPK